MNLRRLWVFSRPPSEKHMDSFIKQIREYNFTDVVFTINGIEDEEFKIKRKEELIETSRKLAKVGVASHIMTWIRPCQKYFKDANEQLRPLFNDFAFRSLLIDAEEPWTLNTDKNNNDFTLSIKAISKEKGFNKKEYEEASAVAYQRASTIISRFWAFDNWPSPIGVTGIVYCPGSVKAFFNYVDYVMPQAYYYSSKSNLQAVAHKRWNVDLPIVMGLKIYGQKGINSYSEKRLLKQCVERTESLMNPEIYEVSYWSYSAIDDRSFREDFITDLGKKIKNASNFIPDPTEISEDIRDSQYVAVVGERDLERYYTSHEGYMEEEDSLDAEDDLEFDPLLYLR